MSSIISKNSECFNWITKQFISKIVDKDSELKDKAFEINSFNVSNVCEEGENYVSYILRLKVDLSNLDDTSEKYQRSYIIKTINKDSRFGKFLDLDEVFQKEIDVYEHILPELRKIWRDAGREVEFGPKFYMSVRDPVKAIVLEELCASGYKSRPKQLGLNMGDVKNVIQKIASFHAASMIYLKNHPTSNKMFYHGILSSKYNNQWRQNMYDKFYQTLVEEISSWEGFEDEAKKFRAWNRNVLMKASRIMEYKPEEFNVLTHGDLWINNMMFHSDSNEIKMLDYQFTSIAHPSSDLLYFIAHSLNEDDRVTCFDIVLRTYYKSLAQDLKTLNYDGLIPPDEESFITDVHRKTFVSAFYSVFHMLVLLLDKEHKLDMNLALKDDEVGLKYRKELYSIPKYVSTVKKYLKFLNQIGGLDNCENSSR